MTGQIRGSVTGSSWLRNGKSWPHASMRLFCFPYAGGGASIFHLWSKYLPQNIEVCPIQLPGREDRLRERPFSTMPSLLDALIPALLSYLDRPCAFFGHSMGALIESRNLVHMPEYSGGERLAQHARFQ